MRQHKRQQQRALCRSLLCAFLITCGWILASLVVPASSANSENDDATHEDFDAWLQEALKVHGGQQPLVVPVSSANSENDDATHEDFDAWLQEALKVHGGQQAAGRSNGGSRGRRRDESSSSSRNKQRPPDPWESTERLTQRPVTVTVPHYGRIQGKREEGIDFWGGIPYAAPPVGSLRFAPPESPPPWAPAKLDGTHFGPDCWQLVDPLMNPTADINYMSEDCLYLNVFTPAGHAARARQGVVFSGTKLLPVMVWFHGGAFQQGGARRAEYDGRRLAERDVVVVTINYRLGALGFMVSSPDGLYGNFGFMDQRAALDWIHNNIKAFGGDPDNVTLFGESAGAIMIGLHLMQEGASKLFHRAIMQSNALGYQFRSVIVADFIGEALKSAIDCRDLECLRAERVEEIMRAQSSLMGVPRSVGDFFTWGPTLTQQAKLTIETNSRFISRSDEHRLLRNLDNIKQHGDYFQEGSSDSSRWSAVNVSQPLKGLEHIPDDIPILIGSNQNEGEMFVHSAFPTSMPKAVYWMFVGALFRDSAARVLKHYRGFVDQVEKEAEELASKQLEEEESKLYYLENREHLEQEYEMLLAMNSTRQTSRVVTNEGVESLVNTWMSGGGDVNAYPLHNETSSRWQRWRPRNPFGGRDPEALAEARQSRAERASAKAKIREERRLERKRARALKEAAKVVVDYRPVMSRIIDDYLFRCPTWHYAHLANQGRERRGQHKNNVYVYRYSHSTYIPGYKECWGKSCHTAELPYVFQAMDVIRSNYSTLGPIAQKDAPSAPEYPYTDILAAYRGALEAFDSENYTEEVDASIKKEGDTNHTYTKAFQRILTHFFGDYFVEDADEELASDMAERWANFARDGNPNYDGSRADWIPWRYHPTEAEDDEWSDEMTDGDFDYWGDFDFSEPEEDEALEDDAQALVQDKHERAYRTRALAAMNMEVAEEDVFRTELRRVNRHGGDNDLDKTFLASRFLFQKSLRLNKNDDVRPPMPRRAARAAVRIAQEFGVLGTGLTGEERWPDGEWDEDFFPELFDLRWPPEGRLIERDCTCDMWDKIRYRY